MQRFLCAFLVYSIIAFASESFFTGVGDQLRAMWRAWREARGAGASSLGRAARAWRAVDWSLRCRTHLWAILVYGLSAAVSYPAIQRFAPGFFGLPWWLRGSAYGVAIFAWEFLWGLVIESLTGVCPWQYRHSPWRIWRYIRPRYFGFWFAFGFALEWAHFRLIPLIGSIFPGA